MVNRYDVLFTLAMVNLQIQIQEVRLRVSLMRIVYSHLMLKQKRYKPFMGLRKKSRCCRVLGQLNSEYGVFVLGFFLGWFLYICFCSSSEDDHSLAGFGFLEV